jgi:xylulokinase
VRSLLLGVDVGTTGCRAALFDERGRPAGQANAPLAVSRPHPGWVEQNVEEIWTAAASAIHGAVADADAQPTEILGAAAGGHSPTLILLDGAGLPVRPAIVWQDVRASAETRELAVRLGSTLAKLLGGVLPLTPSFVPGRLLWLARHEANVLRRAQVALEPKDYVHYRLTGEAASDPWSAKGLASLATGERIDWADVFGTRLDLAPAVRQPHESIGRVTPAVAASLGLAPGTPVAAGWTDGLCCMLGTGVFPGGLGFLTSGTSDVLGTVLPGPTRGETSLLETPTPLGRRVLMGPTQSGGASLEWLARRFLAGDLERALALAAEAPAGARGLVFLPYLDGERAPIWDERARGVFFGLSTEHGLPELARAVLEGVAFSDRHVLDTVEARAGARLPRLRISGGAAHGHWRRIKADVLARCLESTGDWPTARGAAMLAGVAAGIWPDLDAATRAAVQVTDAIEPDPAPRAAYDDAYATYRALYPRLRDLWT